MPETKDETPPSRPSKLSSILKFLLLSPQVGSMLGGLSGVAIVVIGSSINPNDFLRDPGSFAVLFFIVWGFLGSMAGLVVGIIGAIVIAIRR